MLKKILISVIFSLAFVSLFGTGQVKAQTSADQLTTTFSNYPVEQLWQKYCDDRKGDVINLQTWYSGKCTGDPFDPQAIGFSDIVLLDFYTLLQGEPGTGGQQSGVIQFTGSLISAVYQNPPASTADYLAYLGRNLQKHSIVQPAYAQSPGYGFRGLSPILPLWRGFRNITYVLFILIFVLYGFMIMFRFKISAQTAVTIQTALPKIVATLLLITFSYAIAGFLIDMMYVVLGLIMAILAGENFISPGIRDAWGSGAVSLLEVFIRLVLHAAGGLINKIITALTGLSGELQTVLQGAAAIFSGGASVILSFGVLMLFAIFVVLISIFILVKVLLQLLGAMVNVLLAVIFAPFILLMGVLPGRSAFGDWVKNIISNLAVFPAVVTMFTFALIFLDDYYVLGVRVESGFSSNVSSTFLQLPIIGASSNAEAVLALIGFGFFLMTPKVADMIREALKVKGGGFGSALGEPLQFGYGNLPTVPGTGPFSRGYSAGKRILGVIPGLQQQKKP